MKRNLRALFCYICALLIISSNVTAFAAPKENKPVGLPQQVIEIVNGSNSIYGPGAPLSHQTNEKKDKVSLKFASGGIDHTHQYIVASALTVLNNDMGGSIMNSETNAKQIMENADWPDVIGNETDYLTYSGHFYNPLNGKNWLGLSSPTAKTRAVGYFNSAVASYNAGKISDAFKYIGRGTHYVADANEPHHAANLTALDSNHSEFEKFVDTNRTSYFISGNTLNNSVYQTAQSSSVDNLVYASALRANALAGQAQQSSTYSIAANACVQSGITTVAQYLYKFGKTVGIYN